MSKTKKIHFSYYGVAPLDDSNEFNFRETYKDLIESPSIVQNKKAIVDAINDFEKKDSVLKKAIDDYAKFAEKTPLLIAFLFWSKISFIKDGWPDCAKILLENKLIPFQDKDGNLILMRDFDKKCLIHCLELIRCRTEFTIPTRESLTMAFVHFFDWLAYRTRNQIWKVQDPDRRKARDRVLPYDTFISFLEKLDQKSQLIAKLLYFGGSRTLDQVLNLKGQDVHFEEQIVKFGKQTISYPLHVFQDIKMLTSNRPTGQIFLGRQKFPLNRTTVFRNFKEASLLIGIDPLSPKDLTTSN